MGLKVGIAVVLVAALLGGLPAAYADEPTPEPSIGIEDPTPVPSDPSPTPDEPSPSDPSPSDPSQPSPSEPALSPPPILPAPTALPAPTPIPSGEFVDHFVPPPPAPLPRTDGVLPTAGVTDRYWSAYQAWQVATAHVASLTGQVEQLGAQRRIVVARTNSLANQVERAASAAASDTAAIDELARSLYQFGPQLASVGDVLNEPDDYLAAIESQWQVDAVATAVVTEAEVSRRSAAALAATLTVSQAESSAAAARIGAARTALAATTQELEAAIVALQDEVTVGAQREVTGAGCPTTAAPNTLRDGSADLGIRRLCASAVGSAATSQAALAIQWALHHVGAAYACGGVGRLQSWRMDCSSFVSRAYAEGGEIPIAGPGWAPSTREMVPWDGVPLDRHFAQVPPKALRPGDLVLYDTGGATYRHVVMYLGEVGSEYWMVHTNSCGDVAHVSRFTGFPTHGDAKFLVARRVLAELKPS